MKYKLTFIYCIIVLVLSVLPSSSFPKTEITNADKIVHFLMYFFMVGVMFVDNLLVKAPPQSPPTPRRGDLSSSFGGVKGCCFKCSPPVGELEGVKKLLWFLFFAVIFGAIIEIIQYFLPTRSAEWGDLLSNSIGAFVGIIVIFFVKKMINFAENWKKTKDERQKRIYPPLIINH